MSQVLNLKAKGIWTYSNNLSAVPEGALLKADNVVIDSDSLIESRRGYFIPAADFTPGTDRADKFFFYRETLLAHRTSNVLSRYVGSAWVDYAGSVQNPDSVTKIHSVEASQNLYFTSSTGIRKLESVTSTIISAGMYKALDTSGVLTTPVAGLWFLDNNQVAYRVVWGRRDANNNVLLGAPSARLVLTNTTGSPKAVDVTFTVPTGINTTYFYQVYRSALSGGAAIEPNDELGLVYEANYVSGSTVTVSDITPDSLRGATLYTSPSQEGLTQQNDPPLFAKDIEVFRNCVFLANCTDKQRQIVTMLAVSSGGSSGVSIGDVITIGGVDYTGAAAENIAADEFEVVSGGTPAQNISDTAQSLVRVINRSATNTQYYAYYLSGVDDLPGKILLEERGFGGSAFTVLASANGDSWTPALPTSGTSVQSTADTYKNRVFISKTLQPEAFPFLQNLSIGSADKNILRIVASRDSLFVFKEDGLYRISGTSPDTFSVEAFDLTTRLIAPETAVLLNNLVFCLTEQGVSQVSDTGVSNISQPIYDQLLTIFGANLANVQTKSFGISYDTDNKYILATLTTGGEVNPNQMFVYNTLTRLWTKYLLDVTCGAVGAATIDGTLYTDRIFLGNGLSPDIKVERKNYSSLDYTDEEITGFNIVSFSTDQIVLNTVTGISEGDLLFQAANVNAVVTNIDATLNTLTVNRILSTWTVGAASIYKSIPCVVQWVPVTAGNPGITKQFREIALLYKQASFVEAQLVFASDYFISESTVDINGVNSVQWGLFPFDGAPWGASNRAIPIRTYVPLEKSRCSLLTIQYNHRSARGIFKLNGLSLIYENMSERLRRG